MTMLLLLLEVIGIALLILLLIEMEKNPIMDPVCIVKYFKRIWINRYLEKKKYRDLNSILGLKYLIVGLVELD